MKSFYVNTKSKLATLADKIDWRLVTRCLVYVAGTFLLFYLFFMAFGNYELDWRTFFYSAILFIWTSVLNQ